MTNRLLILPAKLMMILHTTAAIAQWEPVAPLPEPNGGFISGVAGGKIVVMGGTHWTTGAKQWLRKAWVLDPQSGTWREGPDLPHPLAYAAVAHDGQRLLIAGGADGKIARREIYCVADDLKLIQIGELSHSVAFAGAAADAGKLFTVGGLSNPDDWSTAAATGQQVDLKNGRASEFTPLKMLGHGFGIPAVAVVGGTMYVFTGAWLEPASGEVRNFADAFAYVLAKDTWQALAPYPKAARGVAAVVLDDHRVYLAGGYGTDAEGFLDTAFIYHVDSGRYTTAPALPFAACTSLVKCGDWVYVLGGEDQKKHRTAQCFRIPAGKL